jgi:hypothetical protein
MHIAQRPHAEPHQVRFFFLYVSVYVEPGARCLAGYWLGQLVSTWQVIM